ncbi:MAG: PHB depolymerase family esterase [Gammaproteobacteria bacterium]
MGRQDHVQAFRSPGPPLHQRFARRAARQRRGGPVLELPLPVRRPDAHLRRHQAVAADAGKPTVTVSGVSAGAAMAHQLHIAYPELLDGAAIIAGAPFGCAEGNIATALGRCMGTDAAPELEPLLEAARAAAADGRLGPASDLAGDRVWLFHGARDTVVSAAVHGAVASFYRAYAPGVELVEEFRPETGHVFPTLRDGGECSALTAPFIGACGYDAAGELLRFLYDGLEAPSGTPGQTGDSGVAAVAEAVVLADAEGAGLLPEAFVYRPARCADGGCPVHLVLHGCGQSTAQIGRQFIEQSGYLPWARANGLVLAFPQVAPSPLNPLACWDWWGYTGPGYRWRDGKQMDLLTSWLERLRG